MRGKHNPLGNKGPSYWFCLFLLELEKKYGDDFVARFLALRNRTLGVRKRADVQQTFELFARVSGDPRIWQWFKEIGCSARRPGP